MSAFTVALLRSSLVLVHASYSEASVGAFSFSGYHGMKHLICAASLIQSISLVQCHFFRLAQALWQKIKSPGLHLLQGPLLQCFAATLDWMCQNRENIKPLQRRKHGILSSP